MKLHNSVQNEPILSNVGEIGEFRIRNSAKAFSILSSGLYANKIRAIIRELSCNAYDSHVAAGKADVPFDVTLPTTFNAFFAVRDYGIGLDHDQVTNIYTTYFESTKSNSNDFVGALGLGSKSPFSYTENFTVTAIKNGTKGIYTAFINEQGVPSIALMHSEASDEPTGVEVKFAVSDRSDFYKFESEAREVFRFFKTVPNITSSDGFEVPPLVYSERDIIPGVHIYEGRATLTAVMGNIAYPIHMPSNTVPDNLYNLFGYGFELNFAIGELDFQASREGLSYIPATITAINNKMQQVADQLQARFHENVSNLSTIWQKVAYVKRQQGCNNPFHAVAQQYAAKNRFPRHVHPVLGNRVYNYGIRVATVDELARRFNVKVRGAWLTGSRVTTLSTMSTWTGGDTIEYWRLDVGSDQQWVIEDTKTGAFERVKYHVKNTPSTVTHYLLSPADPSRPMNTARFFRWMGGPNSIMRSSELLEKPRRQRVRTESVPVLTLEQDRWSRRRDREYIWSDAGNVADYDDSAKRVYVELKGYTPVFSGNTEYSSAKDLFADLNSVTITGFGNVQVFGIRKAGIDAVKDLKHWVTVEEYIQEQVITSEDFDRLAAGLNRTRYDRRIFNNEILSMIASDQSPFIECHSAFARAKNTPDASNVANFKRILEQFAPDRAKKLQQRVDYYQNIQYTIETVYPLLKHISYAPAEEIAKYVNIVDNFNHSKE